MASTPQHRCVFVGNIPYDASEEQLIQICEEVGPVVSFRLVIDRETGKPKGYGFCEYKDEETALSARRNLQGYEINGRQLRVDFAENDKGADRNREQGRGGPGMAVNIEQKKIRDVVSPGDLNDLQPIGLPLAMTAASAVAGAIGGVQAGYQLNKKGLQNQPAVGNDPLTLHLSTLSRNQLTQVISEMKALVTQNKELARQLLLAHPPLSKAILQAHMMLGTVTPQKLQMPNFRQTPGQISQPSWQSDQLGQQLAGLNPLGLPPVTPLPSVSQSSLVHNPSSASLQIPGQPISQLTNLTHVGTLQQATIPGQSGVAADPSILPQPSNGVLARPTPVPGSSTVHHPVLQHPSQSAQGRSAQYNIPAISSIQPFHVTRSMSPNHGEQLSSIVRPGIINPKHKEKAMPSQVTGDGSWINGRTVDANVLQGPADRNIAAQQIIRPSKHVKLESGRDIRSSTPELTASAAIGSRPDAHNIEKHAPQVQLPPEMESALLQQVMNLTPDQLSSLPPEQRQQVLQLQQMLR